MTKSKNIIKMIIHHYQVCFIPEVKGCLNTKINKCNPLYNQTERKKETNRANLYDHVIRWWKKIIEKNPTLLHKTLFEWWGIKETFLNIKTMLFIKLITNNQFNKEKCKAVPLKCRTVQYYPLPPYLFTILLEFLAKAIRQLKEIKEIQIRKATVNLLSFSDNMYR